ncbi:alpha-2-macroglobulin family protein [Roseivivax isoporae]|uniref:PAN domain protein n=1 Tax=Roseivivax isoporae LMG 25204 TaxID=1449351 RepID=X7F4L9_9RHOB|nr:alpha-2-macroglobulin family protein [Roseivivax isoporae]ETX27678.1 PAN domain protein [Roseivivax isoporae LMG 25204]
MRRYLSVALVALGLVAGGHAGPAGAQDAPLLPERRSVVTGDVDFYGSDLQPLYDTTLEACERQCLNDASCGAFTYNTRAQACFPKTGVRDRQPFAGAVSGEIRATSPQAQAQARDRAATLEFLQPEDFEAARAEAAALGLRHRAGDWTPEALLAAAAERRQAGDLQGAIRWTGAALAQRDASALWRAYGRLLADAARTDGSGEAERLRAGALSAAVNAVLRAGPDDEAAVALVDLATALEATGRGRQSVRALRLAQDLAPSEDIAGRLEAAIARHGFRVTDTRVESDRAEPRICAEFSDPLVRAGTDYTPYVQLPDARLVVQPEDTALCVAGVRHGARYTVTFRSGLPAADGETLARDVPVTLYVRDRAPTVRFPGRAYVLPPAPGAGLPVETVNAGTLDLALVRVDDRNLLRAMQDGYFGVPLSQWGLDRFSGEVGETVWTGTAEVPAPLNADQLTRLPMDAALAGQAPGLFALTASVPDAPDAALATQWFLVSDLGLTAFSGSDGLSVVVRGISDAGPRAGVPVSLLSRANRVLARAETDADGIASFDAGLLRGTDGAAPALVLAGDGETDLAFLSLTDPAFDLSDRGVAGREPAGPVDAFLATDRGVYRAGDRIHVTALLRDARARALDGLPATLVLSRPDGVEHLRRVSSDARAGGHVFDLALGRGVPRGTWRVALHVDTEAPPLATATVLVEDFVPERIDFDLALPEGPIDPAAPPSLGIAARYLFGAPGADLPVEGAVTLGPLDRLEALPRWRFGRHDAVPDAVSRSLPADLRTGADGTLSLPLPVPAPEIAGRPYRAEASVRLSEGSGRPVERRITRPLLPEGPMIGIRPDFDGRVAEGTEAVFDLQAFAGAAPEPMRVRWTLNRVETRYQWYELYGTWNWEPVTLRSAVASGEAMLGDDPQRVAVPVDWGSHELVVERLDGPYVASSVGFDAGWAVTAEADPSPDLLELALDRAAYAPGDTATLRIVPRAPGTALVSVLSDRVISMQAVAVPEGETRLPLTVTEEWGAGAYVTVQMIRPRDAAADRAPVRALGLAHAAVDPGEGRLSVRIDAAETADPRAPLPLTVAVDGAEDDTWVTLAAVDAGILNLTGFTPPDPAAHYFGQRRLGVELRDVYGRLIDGQSGAAGTVRTGGDGGASLSMDGTPPTEAVVAMFEGPVQVDASGVARARFDVPDFNGTVRLMAVAWSPRGVGAAHRDVVVRDPVVVTAALPRFLAPGDTARLLLEFAHASGPSGEMALSVTGPGVGAVPASVDVPEGGHARVEVPLSGPAVGDHAIAVALTLPDGGRLTRSLTLPVRRNDPAIAETRRLTLGPGEVLTLDDALFAGFAPDSAEALVSAGPLARFDVPGLLAALDAYPYGCTEQVTSRALPLLSLAPVARTLGLGDDAAIRASIDAAIGQVLARQAPNGAFGLWSAEAGDGWLDAYVTDFLSRARAAGHPVPDRALDAALDNLANRIAYAPDFDRGGDDVAYALFVLAREGRAAMGDLRYYADVKVGAFEAPMALAQLGAALAQYGDQARADALFRQAADRVRVAAPDRGLRPDFGSPLRDAAGLVTLASEARSEAVDRDALAARIAAAEGRLSTQEQAWALLAAQALTGTGGAASDLLVDGVPAEGPFLRRYAGTVPPERLTPAGAAPVTLTITTLGVPDVAPPAGGAGYVIERGYYTLTGDPFDVHAGPVPQGTRLVAVLTVRPASDGAARLMIDDPLPAGFEIDNPALLRAGDISALDWIDSAEARHAEFRSDRFLAAIDRQGAEPLRVAYVLRAVTPGEFHHPAASVEDMYRPEDRARTATARVRVSP